MTHKSTDLTIPPYSIIDSFAIDVNGYASAPQLIASVGLRPFSLRFRNDSVNDRVMFVGESHNGHPGMAAASTYLLEPDGNANVISPSVPNYQTDTCWEIITPKVAQNGQHPYYPHYAYTSNFGTGNISSYGLRNDGTITLLQGSAASFNDPEHGIPDAQPVDSAITSDGRFLYQLLRFPDAVAALRVNNDGSLTQLAPPVAGILPVNDGASGLAVY